MRNSAVTASQETKPESARRGIVFVLSAPSGGGKRTVLKGVFESDLRLGYSVSATTRPPRNGETEGTDYYFLDRDTFEQRIAVGDFVEWAEVHGNLYGTLQDELERLTISGKDTVLELDVQGMRNLKTSGLDIVSVFVMAPSLEELERRLRARGTDDPEVIELRLTNARDEIAARHEYDYVIVNEHLDEAVADLKAIIRAERCRSYRQP